jgi:hypothetical protein
MPTASAGRAYSQPLPVAGGTLPYNVTQTGGTLPPGLALSSNGLLSGTPAAAGVFTFTVSVTDSSATPQTATQTLTIAINTLFITTTALPDGIVGVPYNAPISTGGGTLPLSFSPATAAFPPGLLIQQPAANSHSGALAGTPATAGIYMFSESVVDSSNPAQTATQNYSVKILPAGTVAPATVAFVSQPQNSIGGQLLTGNGVVVSVSDATGAPLAGASVALSFSGAPPCSSAVLGGTLNAITNGNGRARFSDLTIDRGQLGYTLLANAGSASAVSNTFTVNGFCDTGNLSTVRRVNTNTLLPNGKVLVAGGLDSSNVVLASAELYDPSTGLFSPTGSMTSPRYFHSATLLPNGKVLIVGGSASSNNGSPLQSAELYDPATGVFAATGNLGTARFSHTATLLLNGKVLVAGGVAHLTSPSAPGELYDPATGIFTLTGNMVSTRMQHTATLLANGTVLITGGVGFTGTTAAAEIYDPTSSTFASTGSMSMPRFLHSATLLPNGAVLVVGGASGSQVVELYDPSLGTFSLTSSLSVQQFLPSAVTLTDGSVLVNGPGSTLPGPSEIYNPAAGTFSVTGSSSFVHIQVFPTMLPNGTVLFAGGNNIGPTGEIYYSTAPLAPLAITTTSLANGLQSTPYTQMLLEQGGVGNLTWSESGALPAGTIFSAQGVLSGTPTVSGTFPLTFTVIDSSTPVKTASLGLTLQITGPLAITATTLPNALTHTANQPATPYSAQILTTGGAGGAVSFSLISGALPSSITLNPTTGVLSSASVTDPAGNYNFTIQAVSAGPPSSTATQPFTLTLVPLFAGTTPNTLPGGTTGVAYSQNLTSIGGTAPDTYQLAPAITGNAFPPGLAINSPANSTVGQLTGMPTQAGTFTFTIQATDSSTPPQTYLETVTITIAPGVAPPANVTFVSQPQNSIGGQLLAGSPITVNVTDLTAAPISGANVAMSFNGTPSCSAATLGGTLTQTTDATGTATFGNLSIDRGQFGFTLAATAGTITAISNPFSIEGFCDTGSLATARLVHSSVSLPNGTVLIAGGASSFSLTTILSSAELYNPATHSFTTIGNMNSPRSFFTMTLLQNGLVLVSGGYSGSALLSSAELFDPSTNTFTLLPNSMVVARSDHRAALLTNGKVLITGGSSSTGILASAEIFDPATNTFSATSHPMNTARYLHRADLLANGQVLITGGSGNGTSNVLSSAELYDPIADTFSSTGSMATPRYDHASALLFTGKVLVAGGNSGTTVTTTAELYDVSTGTFNSTGNATIGPGAIYGSAPIPVLTDGSVFFAGIGIIARIYDPTAGSFRATAFTTTLQLVPQAVVLPDGTVLVAGGSDSSNNGISNGEIFYPLAIPSAITITTTTLSAATQSLPYTQLLLERGGVGTLTWALASGSNPLPLGLTLSPNGILSGTPTTSGTISFNVQVTDSSVPAKTATASYSLVVNSNFQMSLTLDGPLLAINRSFNATVTLATPVPTGSTVTVALAANPTGVVTISPATQTILAGQTTAVFTLTAGATGGSTVLTATASGYPNATNTLTVTSNLISFGTIPVLAPGQSASLPVSLSFNAPPGGLTINFTSANPSVATITPSVFVPAGLLIPSANPQVTGVTIGSTQVTATATGFAPDTAAVTVTVTASVTPPSISVNATRTVIETLTISAPAPAGGITFNLASDTPSVATVPATVTVPAGQLSIGFGVTGVAQGSANLTVTSAGITTVTAPINVSPQPAINFNFVGTAGVVGNNLVASGSMGITAAPVSNQTMTITSGDPTHFLLSTTPTAVGTASITLQLTNGSFSVPTFYVEGQNFSGTAAITATLIASSAGYTNGTFTVSLYPSGLTYLGNGMLSTTTFSSPTTLTVYLGILFPGSLNFYTYGYDLGPQAPGAIPVAVTSSNTSVGTVTGSPATITPGNYFTQAITFQPVAVGTTNLNLATPTGYFTPSNAPVQLVTTVTPPAINFNFVGASGVIGNNLVAGGSIGLAAAPPSNGTVTITSSDATHFLLSTSPTTVGTASITLQLTAGSTSVPTFYVEGQNFSGTTAITATLTASASSYANGTTTVSLYPSGLTYLGNGTLSTTTFSSPTTLTVFLGILTPGTLNFYTYGYSLGPQAPGPVPVAVTSVSTNVGTISGSPSSIGVGAYFSQGVSFQPVGAGTTNLNLATPTGYSTPANVSVQIVATVAVPAINFNFVGAAGVVGNNLIANVGIGIGAAPPSNETMTITSSDPTHFLLSTSPTAVGTASITLQLTGGSLSVPQFYIEGQNFSGTTAITATLTASAPSYTTGTTTASLYPSGMTYLGNGTLSTTTFSAPTTLIPFLVVLNPGTLTFYTYGYNLGPQAPGAVPVAITSSNTSVGNVTGSPVSIGVGAYFTQAIVFHPATAGTTNLNLATPTGYFTPSNVPVQIVTTVTAPPINFNFVGTSGVVGNNLIASGSIVIAAAPPSNETMTVTSSDPNHFLLSTSPTAVGTASITLQLTGGSSSVPTFYVEGQNFSGPIAISATLTASAAGYSDGITTVNLYPTGLTYFGNGTLSTTTTSGPTALGVYLVLLSPGTLTVYTYGYTLGPQAPGAVPVSVTSSNTSVGTVTGSPASIGVGAYFTSGISFVPVATGTTNLSLLAPAGYFNPSNAPVQIVATVQ